MLVILDMMLMDEQQVLHDHMQLMLQVYQHDRELRLLLEMDIFSQDGMMHPELK